MVPTAHRMLNAVGAMKVLVFEKTGLQKDILIRGFRAAILKPAWRSDRLKSKPVSVDSQ